MNQSSLLLFCLLLVSTACFAQRTAISDTSPRKGEFYVYWGWNRAVYSNSAIHFRGSNYDFTLADVIAKDRQTKFSWNTYFNPGRATIPQYNFRVGYFINDKYNISIGSDHMKYVVQQDQRVSITGDIESTSTDYAGHYEQADILIEKGFLEFEHTDGLNYLNLGLRRTDKVFDFNKVKINFISGAEAGVLIPRTNTTLLGFERYDQFHLSGYGISAVAGINLAFFRHFFLQTEWKAGFINMPDIRTTMSENDHADQHFYFSQWNWLFGYRFRL